MAISGYCLRFTCTAVLLLRMLAHAQCVVDSSGSGMDPLPIDNSTEIPSPFVEAISQSPNSIFLNWTQPDSATINVTSYNVTYNYIGPCMDVEQSSVPIRLNVIGDTRQLTLTSLDEFSDYVINVTALCGRVESEPSIVVQRTLPAAPSGPPQTVVSAVNNETSISLQWDEVECSEQNGLITGYTLSYFPSVAGAVVENVAVVGRVVTLTGLLPGTQYLFQVRAVSDSGASPAQGLGQQTAVNPDVILYLKGQRYENNTVVMPTDIGPDEFTSLWCVTNRINCCDIDGEQTPQGAWFDPSSTEIQSSSFFITSHGNSVVRLQRISSMATPSGIYRCDVPDSNGEMQTLFAGLFLNTEGQLNTSVLVFDGSILTLTCTTSGGPPTTLSWLRDGSPLVVDNLTYRQGQNVLSMETATYETTLTADALTSLVGVVHCIAGNDRGSITSNNITISTQCPELPAIANGSIIYAPDNMADYDIGTIATYDCDPGFVLFGNMERTCTQAGDGSGIWPGGPLICESLSLSVSPVSVTTLLDNREVSFTCQSAPSVSSSLSITWFLNGINLAIPNDQMEDLGAMVSSFSSLSDGFIGSTLTVNATERSQNASVVCQVMAGDPPTVVMSTPAFLTLQFARLELESSSYTVNEGAGSIETCAIVTESTLPSNTNVSNITFIATDNTADVNQDLLPVTQVYPLSNTSAGARYCSNWTIVDDVAIEPTEEFRVSLYVTDPFILLGEIATVTIQDNDLFSIGFQQSQYVVSEDAGSFQPCIEVSLPEGVSTQLTVTLTVTAMDGGATSPDDYELFVTDDIIITSSTTIYCIDLGIYDDSELEPGNTGEDFTLTLSTNDSYVEFTNQVATIIIHDNDVSLPSVILEPPNDIPVGGQLLDLNCEVVFNGGVRSPIEIIWLDSLGERIINTTSGVQLNGTIETKTGAVSTLTLPVLLTSQAGSYTCRGVVDTFVFGSRVINRQISFQVQIPPVSVTVTPTFGSIYIGKPITVSCTIGADASVDIAITPRISWEVTYVDDGEPITDRFEAMEIVAITPLVFSTTLQYNPILRNMNFTCVSSVQPEENDQSLVIASINTTVFEEVLAQSPPISLRFGPSVSNIIDIPPFNVYAFTYIASLPSDVTGLQITFTWAAVIARDPQLPEISEILNSNGTISIDNTISTSTGGGIEYTSTLTVNHTSGEVGLLTRRCIINRVFTDQVLGGTITIDGVVRVRSSSLPQDITTLRVSATSHELAIFTWFVPSISYTPETYILQYQSLGGEVSGPVMMTDPILGTTDLSATNQEYQVVVDNLLPGTTYTYYLMSTNVEGSVVTPPGRTFTTQNPIVNVLLPGNQPPNLNSIPIGASIELRFNYTLINPSLNTYVLLPLNHTPLQEPQIVYEPVPDWVRVTYNQASPSLTGEYVLCRSGITSSPSPRKRDVGGPGTDNNGPPFECGERVMFNVYVPSLSISTNLLVVDISRPSDSSPQVTCLSSDPLAPVRWRTFLGTYSFFDTDYQVEFIPSTDNTAVFPLEGYEGSTPKRTEVFICDLINIDEDPSVEIDPQNVTVRFITNPVAVLNNNRETSQNAVINTFSSWSTTGLPALSLRCLSSENNNNLIWETQDVLSVPSILTEEDALSIPFISIDYHKGINVNNRDVIVLINPISNLTTGVYSCRSVETNFSSRAIVIQTQPYWEVIAPSSLRIELPIGACASIRALYADFSDGNMNTGSGFAYTLNFVPCVAPPDTEGGEKIELVNSVTSRFSNEIVYSFIVNSALEHAGTYEINATHIDSGMTYSTTLELIVTVPYFVEFDTLVSVQRGKNVTLRCIPNDTSAPVLWESLSYRFLDLNDRPDVFILSPPGLNHTLTFNATLVAVDFSGLGELIDNPSSTQVLLSTYSCGLISAGISTRREFIDLRVQPERLRIEQRSGRQKVFSNVVINDFQQRGFGFAKRSASQPDDYDYYEEGRFEILELDCQGAQGDHSPLWFTDNSDLQDDRKAVICDQSINSQYLLSNYSTRLRLYNVSESVNGRYTCTSLISGLSQDFTLNVDNPFVERFSPSFVTVVEGEPLTLRFRVAVNSNGNSWTTSRTSFMFMNSFEEISPVTFTNTVANYPQDYEFSVPAVLRSQEGMYTAFVRPDAECEVPTFPGCGAAEASITVDVIATCPQEPGNGILWPKTQETVRATLPCSRAGSGFRTGTSVTRACQRDGVWGAVDFTSCTLESASSDPFLTVYFTLIASDRRKKQVNENFVNEQALIQEMEDLLSGLGVNASIVNILNVYYLPSIRRSLLFVSFEIILSSGNEPLANFTNYITNNLGINGFGGFPVDDNSPIGFQGVAPTESCECGASSTSEDSNFIELCAGLSLSPCNCTINGNCQCQPPYVGDGSRCTLDSDGDGFPDVALDAPVCQELSRPYCIQDVCPSVHNVDQDPSDCEEVINIPEFTGCLFGPDPVWNIDWPNTERDTVSTQRCPGELDTVTGNANRYCDSDGVWSEPDVLECQSIDFAIISQRASTTFSLPMNNTVLIEQTTMLTMQLAVVTEPSATPLLPTSLNTTNEVLSGVIDVLEEVENRTDTQANEFVIDVFNNILERNNTQGWMALQSSDAGSQVLLDNAERFGVLLARSQNNSETGEPMRISRPNIAISAKQYDASKEVGMEDLTFPQEEDLANYTRNFKPAEIQIPPGLLQERLSQQNDEEEGLPVVFILFQNLEAFLPASVTDLSNNTRGASVVISSLVGRRGIPQQSDVLRNTPISLNYTFNKVDNASEYRCVFWNFSQPVGNGQWYNDGVQTVRNSTDDFSGSTKVECASSHLTSFAVLVDVAGGLANITQAERTALQVVSYIGCIISVICLFIAIIFFLLQGKKLLTSVHYFVHLNLSISLLLAYLVFIVGVETAIGNLGGCAFVAALLHYLFLSAFCWMLCEGVMLYLLLVVVFSRVAKQWWFFVLLGYLTPLPFVVITLAARWQYYGVRDADGNLQFCWLSTEEGTIFGFVAPMLMIILINVVFLGFALRALWRNKKSQVKRNLKEQDENKVTRRVAKSIFVASIVLLPLLGLTWVFGLLTINSNTTFFAWIFTILNSLQGLAILFFHVIRSDKVWSKIGPRLTTIRKRTFRSTLRRYEVSSGTSTLDTRKYQSRSTGDTEMGMGTLKSTLPRDGTLKKDLSSSISEGHSVHSEYVETKIDLAAETANEKLPTLQEEEQLGEGFVNPLSRGDSYEENKSTSTNQDEMISKSAHKDTNDSNGDIIENPNAFDGSHESQSTEGERIGNNEDFSKDKNLTTDSTGGLGLNTGGVSTTKSKDEESTL